MPDLELKLDLTQTIIPQGAFCYKFAKVLLERLRRERDSQISERPRWPQEIFPVMEYLAEQVRSPASGFDAGTNYATVDQLIERAYGFLEVIESSLRF